MYLPYYDFKRKPFQISPDPSFLWLGEKHMEALATLRYGILDNKGFLLLTGDVGTGKTTLINALLNTLGDKVLVATIRDPDLEPMDFFQYTLHAFGLPEIITSKGSFLILFEDFLNRAHSMRKKVLLIIDEAQRINQKVLEEVRLLSNIENQKSKLINIFFVGQIEFNDILLRPVNRPIRQRITVNYNIETLSEQETVQYIKHRVKIARLNTSFLLPNSLQKPIADTFAQESKPLSTSAINLKLFTDSATREVYFYSRGYPRLINIICDRSLLTGFSENKTLITAQIVKECAKELEIPDFGHALDSRNKSRETNNNNTLDMPPLQENDIPIEREPDEPIVARRTVKTVKNNEIQNKILQMGIISLFLLTFLYLSITLKFTDFLKDSELFSHVSDLLHILDDSDHASSGVPKFIANPLRTPNSVTSIERETTATHDSVSESPLAVLDGNASSPSPFDRTSNSADLNNQSNSKPIIERLILPFPSGATLPPSPYLKNLDRIVETLTHQKTFKVIITGYAGGNGSKALIQEQSIMRATALKIFLVGKGLDPARIETRRQKPQDQVKSTADSQEQEANNRVEIDFLHNK